MSFFMEVLLGGLLAGVMYSLVAIGFVLIYKASGVFNFAQGSMVLFAALTFVSLLERGLPFWLAFVLSLLSMLLLALLLERLVLRHLVNRPPITLFMATLGLSYVVEGVAQALWALLALAFGLLPFIGNDYWFSAILIPFLVLSLAGLGLNLLTGYAGQLSLGSAAFMAVGAFASYKLQFLLPGLPLLLSFVAGGVVAAAVGVVFGLPSLRIKGFYLLVSTLAAQFFVEWLLTKFAWFSNGNESGVITAPPLLVAGHDFGSPAGRYLLTLSVVLPLFVLAGNLVRSSLGRNWMAVRDMDTAAAVIGIPILRTKLLAFAISSFILGVAGSLWAFTYLGTVEPHGFDLSRSFQVLFIIILGGMGSILGNFLGAAFIVLLPIVLSILSGSLLSGVLPAGQLENLQKIIFGVLIILFLIKEPDGLARLWQGWRARARLWPLRF